MYLTKSYTYSNILVNILATIVLCILYTSALAEPASALDGSVEAGPTLIQTQSGCGVWLYHVRPTQITTWSGECINGLVSGAGVLQHGTGSNVERYAGEMLNGKANGPGLDNLPNGATLSGTFRDGRIIPPVKYTKPDGYNYEGGWNGSSEEGNGIATWVNGSHYEGQWHDGTPTGIGKMTYRTNNEFVGHFRNGKFNGTGVLSYSGGGSISGTWEDNQIVGEVTSISPTGDRYDGLVIGLRRNGAGTYIGINGDRYVGNWTDNVPDGNGVFTQSDGQKYSGNWIHGCFWTGSVYVAKFVSQSMCSQLSLPHD